MTFGEMAQWTSRLNEVCSITNSSLKRSRLENLHTDFTSVYGAGGTAIEKTMIETIENEQILAV